MNQPYDAPFDLFDATPAPVVRAVSAREADDAVNKVSWRRYKIAGIVCWEWVNGHPPARDRCSPAVWLRIHGPDQRALCSRHKQEYMDKDALAVPRGE